MISTPKVPETSSPIQPSLSEMASRNHSIPFPVKFKGVVPQKNGNYGAQINANHQGVLLWPMTAPAFISGPETTTGTSRSVLPSKFCSELEPASDRKKRTGVAIKIPRWNPEEKTNDTKVDEEHLFSYDRTMKRWEFSYFQDVLKETLVL